MVHGCKRVAQVHRGRTTQEAAGHKRLSGTWTRVQRRWTRVIGPGVADALLPVFRVARNQVIKSSFIHNGSDRSPRLFRVPAAHFPCASPLRSPPPRVRRSPKSKPPRNSGDKAPRQCWQQLRQRRSIGFSRLTERAARWEEPLIERQGV